MRDVILVGLGGFVGSVSRYLLGGFVLQQSGASRFPWGTLAVNVLGCLVIGVLAGVAEVRGTFSPATRLLVFTGLLGGFTTFSAFGYETFALARTSGWGPAVANVALQVTLGLAAVWIGHRGVAAVLSA